MRAFRVGDGFRTNGLSHKEGGVTVCVEMTDGTVLEYDKIKSPTAYIKRAKQNRDVVSAWVK